MSCPFRSSISKPVVSLCLVLSAHIMMSGGHISTVAIVGPSVCLLTKEDSLSYNRLMPPPPKDSNLISNENRSNHSFAGGVMGFALEHTSKSLHPLHHLKQQQSDLGRWRQQWDALTLKDDELTSFHSLSLCHLPLPLSFPCVRACAPYLWARVKVGAATLGVRRKRAKTNRTPRKKKKHWENKLMFTRD